MNSYRKKYVSANGLSPQFNKAVGSFTYFCNFVVLFLFFTHFWPNQVINVIQLGILGGMSFALTKIELVFIGFWKY